MLMDIFQFGLVLVFSVMFVVFLIVGKRFPEKIKKFLPYNYLLMGIIFCYLGKDDISFGLIGGIFFLVYGAYLLFRSNMQSKKDFGDLDNTL
jgi:hypothetical protein